MYKNAIPGPVLFVTLCCPVLVNINSPTGTFFIKKVGSIDDGTPYYVVQASGQTTPGDGQADLCLHAIGGSIAGKNIALYGGVDYNTNNPNGTFFITPYNSENPINNINTEGFQNKKEEQIQFTQILKSFAIFIATFIARYTIL